jgi:hypothetical protein
MWPVSEVMKAQDRVRAYRQGALVGKICPYQHFRVLGWERLNWNRFDAVSEAKRYLESGVTSKEHIGLVGDGSLKEWTNFCWSTDSSLISVLSATYRCRESSVIAIGKYLSWDVTLP